MLWQLQMILTLMIIFLCFVCHGSTTSCLHWSWELRFRQEQPPYSWTWYSCPADAWKLWSSKHCRPINLNHGWSNTALPWSRWTIDNAISHRRSWSLGWDPRPSNMSSNVLYHTSHPSEFFQCTVNLYLVPLQTAVQDFRNLMETIVDHYR